MKLVNKITKYLFIVLALFTITSNVYAENKTDNKDIENITENENIDETNEETDEEENEETDEVTDEENIDETEDTNEENIDNSNSDESTNSIKEEINGNILLIEDDANLLTPQEREKLRDKMTPLTKYGHIALKTINENYTTTANYTKDYYGKLFNEESGTLLVIDMKNRIIYIASNGYNKTIITDSKSEIITDNSYKYASNGDYYSCAESIFDQINTLLDGGKIIEPMRHISNIFIAILLSFFINFFIVVSKAKVKKESDFEVLKNCNINCTAKNIIGTKTGQRKEYSPIETSSGGSSGGGGGGGGSSCSGGGHSF